MAIPTPYTNLWDTRRSLGVMRAIQAENWYFGQFFQNEIRSTDAWIDFEKMPIRKRKLAPFVLPKARGRGVWEDSQRAYRFKPGYIKVEETIDDEMPLTFQPGMGSVFDANNLTDMQRLDLIRAQMLSSMDESIDRRHEWMRAQATIYGKYTMTYDSGESFLVDLQRNPAHTITLGTGSRFGDSGVSIVDFIQANVDRMNNAEFGGFVRRITMSSTVASILRKDTEFMSHMDLTVKGGTITFERGVVTGGANGGKVYKFGEMLVGGASGVTIELWVNDEVYLADNGIVTRYLAQNQMLFTADPSSIMGYMAYGKIIDRDAQYQALPKFPKNYLHTEGDVTTEYMNIKSAPLAVTINPDATLVATVIA
ncbi:major capsid protein [Sphingomonas sp. TREG-RG-20F-R18-01]|uniref:major capsid protein n=1 Tax=Sphingomonas sp. TREG-RG-20F-R18-01 TaxID=2914982 RepID=UPI001F565C04|nr:major capsid protein [Sphingomonas sp. TREG-RG-20F-R18-01]